MANLRIIPGLVWAMVCAAANDCLPIQATHIRAVDLAAVLPAFGIAGNAAIAPAPLAGVTRAFAPADLRRAAARLGVALPERLPDSVCFAYPLRRLSAAEIQQALTRSGWTAPVEIADFTRFPVPSGEMVFAKPGQARPLRADGTSLVDGEIRYAPGRRQRVWVRFKPLTRFRIVAARVALPAGTRIGVEDVTIIESERAGPDQLQSPEEAAGRVLRRSLAAGEAVRRASLTEPRAIDPGQSVHLTVRSGQANLSMDCVAESGGRTGDRILLRNPASGAKFKAEVTGAGRAVIALGDQP